MTSIKAPDPVCWFDAFGVCRCGKSAQGVLRGPRNESFGPYCTKCATSRLAKAQRERAAWLKANDKEPNEDKRMT